MLPHHLITWVSHSHTCLSHDYHMSVTWLSHDYHMSITCLSHDYHMSVTWLSHDYHMTVTWLSHDLTWGSRQMRIDWRPVGIFEACFRPPASWTHHCTCHGDSPGSGRHFLCTACYPTVKQTDALSRLGVGAHIHTCSMYSKFRWSCISKWTSNIYARVRACPCHTSVLWLVLT